MDSEQESSSEGRLVFTKEEWETASVQITREMTEYLARYRTPIFMDHGDHGEGWGSGSFIEVDRSKFILTNQHVATIRHSGQRLGFQMAGQEKLILIQGHHVELGLPLDLALLPVPEAGWTGLTHGASPLNLDKIAAAHSPVPTEILAFAGFAGKGTSFHFDTLFFKATTSVSREVPLPTDPRWDIRFHFGLDYRPDLATTVVGNDGLPDPRGLSGSAVWNTRFVEAKIRGIDWTPDLAQVTGVVWGWPSQQGLLVATRAEHLRSFLQEAPAALATAT